MTARTIATWALLALSTACARPPADAPVIDRAAPLRQPETETRTVIAGDTLYSIAWESGRDYRELARWNGIGPPYIIQPGQSLRLYPPEKSPAASATAPGVAGARHTVRSGETLYSISVRYDVTVAQLSAWNNIPPPYRIVPGQTLRVSATTPATAASTRPRAVRVESGTPAKGGARPGTASATAPKPSSTAMPAGGWMWPTAGRVLPRASGGSNKGIDIAGKRSQAIVAAASGTVVYQGSGLRGYGQLIIIKHNAEFLSAYAHCDKIVVREGDVIKRGQKISEMGSTGTDSVKLHFEIRYRGTPVDPLDFLPKK